MLIVAVTNIVLRVLRHANLSVLLELAATDVDINLTVLNRLVMEMDTGVAVIYYIIQIIIVMVQMLLFIKLIR